MAIFVDNRLWRGGKITNRLSRIKYFRGHGVHSPYVYSIVRNVFMYKWLKTECRNILQKIDCLSLSNKSKIEIANVAVHCNFSTISIDKYDDVDLIICDKDCPDYKILSLATQAENNGIAIVILHPYLHKSVSNQTLKSNRSTSIDRFDYLIFFNNYLPKQHFKL